MAALDRFYCITVQSSIIFLISVKINDCTTIIIMQSNKIFILNMKIIDRITM